MNAVDRNEVCPQAHWCLRPSCECDGLLHDKVPVVGLKQEFELHFKKSLTNRDCEPLRTSIAECDFVINEKVATLSREKLAVSLFPYSLFALSTFYSLYALVGHFSYKIDNLNDFLEKNFHFITR